MVHWLLKKGEDRRIRSGHPWVFSNELQSSPRGLPAGEYVELRDNKGNYLARGYGNPNSLIAFRALTWADEDISSLEFIKKKLKNAWNFRFLSGLQKSFRWCFSEVDSLPGIIIDRYLLSEGNQVFCVQILTAGMSKILKTQLAEFLLEVNNELFNEKLSKVASENTAIVLRNDVNIRKLEGLEVESPQVIKSFSTSSTINLSEANIVLDTLYPFRGISLQTDLIAGQKTGFFLDQRQNIFQLINAIEQSQLFSDDIARPIRILDLCCYVGHWSTQLSAYFAQKNKKVEVTLVDISTKALGDAKKNVMQFTNDVKTIQLDVVKDLDQIADNSFDIVIADPPAFIKAKKDIPQGSHAYLKINTHAFRVAAYKGIIVSCSCSGLFEEDVFHETLRKSQQRNSQNYYKVFAFGGHSVDHPLKLSFPEGKYLKMIAHLKH